MPSGIRVSAKAELAGLDVPKRGGLAYPPGAEVSSQLAAVSVASATPAATAWQPPQLDQPYHQFMYKQNCWEFKQCGRQPGGAKVSEMGVCPSATTKEADTCNSGRNAGRICWAVAGTFCGGKVQGTAAQKRCSCMSCDFYYKVKEEEGSSFQIMRKIEQRTV